MDGGHYWQCDGCGIRYYGKLPPLDWEVFSLPVRGKERSKEYHSCSFSCEEYIKSMHDVWTKEDE